MKIKKDFYKNKFLATSFARLVNKLFINRLDNISTCRCKEIIKYCIKIYLQFIVLHLPIYKDQHCRKSSTKVERSKTA